MGHPGARLDKPRELPIGQVDRVRQHRPLAKPPGAVIDVDIITRFREQAGNLGDLARVFRHVGLPPGAADSRSISAVHETANRGVTA